MYLKRFSTLNSNIKSFQNSKRKKNETLRIYCLLKNFVLTTTTKSSRKLNRLIWNFYRIHLVFAATFLLLLGANSIHSLYVYFDVTFGETLARYLSSLNFQLRGPTWLHFAEAILSLASLIFSIFSGFFIFRIMKFNEKPEIQSENKKCKQALLVQGLLLLITAVMEIGLLMTVREHWKLFDSSIIVEIQK